MRPVLPALFELTPGMRPVPSLVEAWPDEGDFTSDPFGVTLRLREARWSDGEPITARDVRFSWERLREGPTGYRYRFLNDVEVLADRRVRLVFDRPVLRWWSLFSLDDMVLPAHAYSEDWRTGPSVSGGPYRIASWEEGLRVRLVRNERYWGEQALLGGVDVLFVPDDQTRLQLLDREELDAAFFEGEVNIGRRARARGYEPVSGALNGSAGISGAWGPTWWELDLDPRRIGGRVAAVVTGALDTALAAEILEDSGQAMDGIPSRFPVDGAEADGLPAIAGPWSGRGVTGGRAPGSFRLTYSRGSAGGSIARWAHFRLRELGITAELVALDADAFERSLGSPDVAQATIRLRRGADAPDPGSYRGASGEADALIDRAEAGSGAGPRPVTGLDPQAWSAAQELLAAASTLAPLARVRTWIVGRGVAGPRPTGASTGPLWNAASWRFAEDT